MKFIPAVTNATLHLLVEFTAEQRSIMKEALHVYISCINVCIFCFGSVITQMSTGMVFYYLTNEHVRGSFKCSENLWFTNKA